ncbi:hypothetical protein PILCRDRAFT_3370 [Piloderma croceum F 1598]|uniref:Uncharacterized protein n=1 Tax=Piloderma croceum (strain F 1598) TaxID=765440 RepID=A0A0C3BPE2_PILCF|nr:hypothetical protein PILCRDRAFT_3370 [Piloderma croceum F 1598]
MTTPRSFLRKLDACIEIARQEPDINVRVKTLRELDELRRHVVGLIPDGSEAFLETCNATLLVIVRHNPQLRGIMKSFAKLSEESRNRHTATQAMQSSPSLTVMPQYGQTAYSASAVALTPQQPLYTNSPADPPFRDSRSFGQHMNTQHLHLGRSAAEYITSTSQGPSMPPSTEQHRGHVQGHIRGGQQYRQLQRGAPPRGGSTHQFAPPNAPGPSMAQSAEEHQAYVPERIMTYEEMQHVERQVNEDRMPPMSTQGPGMGQ